MNTTKSMIFSFKSSMVTKLMENIAIDFPSVSVKECAADLPHERVIKIEFVPNELLEDRIHYYILGYNASKLNG